MVGTRELGGSEEIDCTEVSHFILGGCYGIRVARVVGGWNGLGCRVVLVNIHGLVGDIVGTHCFYV